MTFMTEGHEPPPERSDSDSPPPASPLQGARAEDGVDAESSPTAPRAADSAASETVVPDPVGGETSRPHQAFTFLTAEELIQERADPASLMDYLQLLDREQASLSSVLSQGLGCISQLGLAILPGRRLLVDPRARPSRWQPTLDRLARRLTDLPVPPVRGGPVIFVWRIEPPDPQRLMSGLHCPTPFVALIPPGSKTSLDELVEQTATTLESSSSSSRRDSGPRRFWRIVRRLWSPRRAVLDHLLFHETPQAAAPQRPISTDADLDGHSPSDEEFMIEQEAYFDDRLRLTPNELETYLARAGMRKRIGNIEGSLEDYLTAVRLDPDNLAIRAARAEVLLYRGDFDVVVEESEAILEEDHSNAQARLCLAHALHLQGETDEAIAVLEAGVALDPEEFRFLFLLGMLQADSNRLDDATETLTRALEIRPDDLLCRSRRAVCREAHGDFDGAMEDLHQILGIEPGNALARYQRGMIFLNRLRTEGETQHLDQALADFTTAIENAPEIAPAYFARGEIHRFRENLPQALADYDKALEIDPDSIATRMSRATTRLMLGDAQGAVEDCDKALEQGVDAADVYYTRAMAQDSQGNSSQALADCDAALRLDPEHARAYNHRGLIGIREGRLEDALADLNLAIEYASDWFHPRGNRGALHALMGHHEDAVEDFSEVIRQLSALESPPSSNSGASWSESAPAPAQSQTISNLPELLAQTYGNRGMALAELGRLDAAREDVEEAVRLAPSIPRSYELRGQFYLRRGDYAKAVEDFTRRLALEPEPIAEAYLERGQAYLASNEAEKALADFEKVVELEPDRAAGHALRSAARRELGARSEALASAETAMQLDPQDPWSRHSRALAALDLGAAETAIADLTALLKRFPDAHHARLTRSRAFATKGLISLAVADIEDVLEKEPSDPNALHSRAWLSARQGEYAAAQKDLQALLGAHPDHPVGLNALSWLRATCPDEQFRDGESAVKLAMRCLEILGKDNLHVIDTLAAAYAEAGNFEEACATQEKAVELAGEARRSPYQKRLDLYREGRAYRVDKDTPDNDLL